MDLNLPNYILAFDPGGTAASWSYCVSKVDNQVFIPVEVGYVPIVKEIARPDMSVLLEFKLRLETTYSGRIDVVAERFIARGFATWLTEYIAFSLGWWTASWTRGQCRFIMAAQWKRQLKRWYGDYEKTKETRFENWWEYHFSSLSTPEEIKKKIVHKQDSCAIGLWFWLFELGVVCCPDGLETCKYLERANKIKRRKPSK